MVVGKIPLISKILYMKIVELSKSNEIALLLLRNYPIRMNNSK